MGRFLVTGATGFLGRHVVQQLLAEGHDVSALVRSEPLPAFPDRVILCSGDVTDQASVRNACEGCIGAYHCAGHVSRDAGDADSLRRVHVLGIEAALDAMREAGVRRVIVVSTSGTVAVSASPEKFCNEDSEPPLHIISRWPYYACKHAAETAALKRNTDSFEVICVLPSLLLGPGDLRESSTGDVRKFLEGRIPFKPAGGLSFVDVRDVACAMRSAMEKGQAGRRYLLGTSNLTLGAFFEKLSDISGTRAPRFRMPRNPVAIAGAFGAFMHSLGLPLDRGSAEIAQFYWYLDSSRAKMELDWVPRDPDETLRDTVADLNARGVVKCRVSKVRRGLRCCFSSSAASDDLLLNR